MDKKVVSGYENGFNPDDSVTNSEMTQILFNALKLYNAIPTNGYAYGDYKYVFYDGEVIKPYNKMTRAEFVAMVSKIFGRGSGNIDSIENKFSDLDKHHWAFEYIMDAAE